MPVKTWVGRFAITDGQPQEEGPYLRSFPRQRPDEGEDELYVLVEPASSGSEEHCVQLVDAIGRAYQQDTLSVTGAVLRALRAAHKQLRDWNERSLPEHRVAAGVSCLAVQGRTAFLAQIGPSVAYHVGDGRFQRIVPEESADEPLGQTEAAQPTFSRYQLSPGDLLLLAPSRIDELLDEETLRSILLRGADAALKELFRLVRDQQEFSLVLLACVVEPEIEAAPAEPDTPAVEANGSAEEATPAPAEDAPPPLEPAVAGTPPAGLSQSKVRLKGAEAGIRYPRTTGLRTSLPRIPRLMLAALLALALAGLLAWYLLPGALQESRDDQFETRVEEAGAGLEAALATDDPAARRAALEAADRSLAEAEMLRSGDPTVAELRERLDTALADLNAIITLDDPVLLVDLSERVSGAVSLGELELGGGGAYLLDREQGRVIAVTLGAPEPSPVVILEPGSLVGTETIGWPQHIAWADTLGALLVLDDTRRLISITPGEAPRLLSLRDAQAWGSADGIVYADESLYVLDRAGDQVWRYLPTESGFDSERDPILGGIDLEMAVEMAVADALYVVLDNGTIIRSQFGLAETLLQGGIDQPLVSPASPSPLPASGRLLVADRGGKRIVVFTLTGDFLQQWVSPTPFSDLRAIAVDAATGRLYILESGALYYTTVPPPP